MRTFTALSVKQPWASLIASGKKSIETRSWTTSYRGPILICSGQSPDTAAMRRFGVVPAEWEDKYPPGVALCVVSLVTVEPMTQRDEVAACCPRYAGAFAWRFGPIVAPVTPFSVRGQLGLFKVQAPDEPDPALSHNSTSSQGE